MPAMLRASESDAIRPFRSGIPQEALVDLRRGSRRPGGPTERPSRIGHRAYGSEFQEIVLYWGTDYDWRKAETKLNTLPQFMTSIDGLDIHFIHVRSRHPNALPLLIAQVGRILFGWSNRSARSPIQRHSAKSRSRWPHGVSG